MVYWQTTGSASFLFNDMSYNLPDENENKDFAFAGFPLYLWLYPASNPNPHPTCLNPGTCRHR